MTTLIAFHGSQAIKDKYLARVRAHRAADELIQGTGWEASRNRGCAVGCTLNRYSHEAYETELGIPRVVAYLEDLIFERLPRIAAMSWPESFLAAIQPGADLGKCNSEFLLWTLDSFPALIQRDIETLLEILANAPISCRDEEPAREEDLVLA